jgi:rubrerythrin
MEKFKTYDAILEFGIRKERQANRFYLAMAITKEDAAFRLYVDMLAHSYISSIL